MKGQIKCKAGCYSRPPFFCKCKGSVKINNPLEISSLKEEEKLGKKMKDGHTERRLKSKGDR